MSEAKFTKGEWAILPAEEDKEYLRIRGTFLGGRYKIANVIDLKDHHNGMNWCARERAESMANASLIKTSPKMYEMLIKISKTINSGLYEIELADAITEFGGDIENLLAKARGES